MYRCQLQNAANVTRLSLDSISKPMTKILYTDAFTQRYFHKDMFLHRRLHIHMRLPRDGFTHKHLHAQVLYTGVLLHLKLLHTDVRALLNTDAFTLRCCWGMLLHARAFTQGFFWHKVSFTHRSFYSKYAYAEIFLHRNIHLYKTVFQHRYFTKRYFCTDILYTFTERCFYTLVLLD